MNIAIWTDSVGKIKTIHHKPSDIDVYGAHLISEIPDSVETEYPWIETVRYYTTAEGFHYKYENPLEEFSFTDTEIAFLEDAYGSDEYEELLTEYTDDGE